MSLPNQIDSTTPPGAEDISLGDDRIRAFKQAVLDIFGIPAATNINNALFGVVAAGLQSLFFQDSAADPTIAGQLRRNGSDLRFHNGVSVVNLGAPTGLGPLPWPTATAPTGWVLCDGAAISRTTFAALFAVIGTTYGVGDGSTTFNVPNCKGRIPVGFDSGQTEFNALGKTGGEKVHTLTTAEMPVHNHGVTDNGHAHGTNLPLSNTGGSSVNWWQGNNSLGSANPSTSTDGTGISIQNAGSGNSHNVLNPYITFNYIIKA